ncbi:hypothetical protein E2C01_082728 [Portunus trituberculatus]|uniref:Uncharacterized protein n=1 Tax=Portunus trituberculatus TaxID=210409 RepID=A0A5B7IZW2_PORTR|nr:hypothetical protein [Portunus trituberculatus]
MKSLASEFRQIPHLTSPRSITAQQHSPHNTPHHYHHLRAAQQTRGTKLKLIPLTQLNQQRQGLGPSYSKQSSWMDLNELLTTSGPSSLSPFSQETQPGL